MDDSADSAASRFRPARGRAWASVVVGAAFVLTQDVDAAALNLNRYLTPLSTRAGPALISDDAHDRAMQCLTQAIYYEAASEPIIGQQAVAQVVLNRVKHPAFPKSVCGVVYEGSRRATGCQFTFTCDGSLSRRPLAVKWLQAQSVAADSLAGRTADVVGASTHYHASWMTPYWQSSMVETARIGGHIFYQKPGLQPRWTPSAVAYDGAERAGPSATLPPAPTEFANPRRRARQTDFARRRSGPATFSVWGLRVATLTPVGKTIVVQDDQ